MKKLSQAQVMKREAELRAAIAAKAPSESRLQRGKALAAAILAAVASTPRLPPRDILNQNPSQS